MTTSSPARERNRLVTAQKPRSRGRNQGNFGLGKSIVFPRRPAAPGPARSVGGQRPGAFFAEFGWGRVGFVSQPAGPP
ncbi:MAG TPA: hypothetical protein VF933_23610, partial [Streptosporangiaceae bacterium]